MRPTETGRHHLFVEADSDVITGFRSQSFIPLSQWHKESRRGHPHLALPDVISYVREQADENDLNGLE